MSRQCDATGCPSDVASGKFMCIRHWRMVPLEIQRTINERFRACRKDFGFLSDSIYLMACISAINHIAKSEGRFETDNSYRRLLRGVQKRAAA